MHKGITYYSIIIIFRPIVTNLSNLGQIISLRCSAVSGTFGLPLFQAVSVCPGQIKAVACCCPSEFWTILITLKSPCMVKHSRDDRSRSKSRSLSRSKSRYVPSHTACCVSCAARCKLSSAELTILAGVVTGQSHRHSAMPEGINTCLTARIRELAPEASELCATAETLVCRRYRRKSPGRAQAR